MEDRVLTFYQALQLLALGPCVFMLAFLCLTSRKPLQAITPALFFFTLGCSFCLPLLDAFPVSANIKSALLMGDSMSSAFVFLLVYQFVSGTIAPLACWSILAVPLIGGSTLVYAMQMGDVETCVLANICLKAGEFKQLYFVFSAALTLLLTIAVFHRIERASSLSPKLRRLTDALVFSLIVLEASLLGMELAQMGEFITRDKADLAETVLRIGVIYIALTSIFRVFDRSFEIDFERIPSLRPSEANEKEKDLSDKIRALMEKEKLYRRMDISRETLAKHLAVTEHTLSRTVNLCFNQSISALLNQYRVKEAQERLASEQLPITTIAFEVGFNSIPSFNRVFKLATGLSPTAYREQKQKERVA